ncbi:MAG: type II toxin-antitoxin system VapC family toxin [Candidatus Lokiarchaeota archaeon]|nr:type II toxin-antitoxin system VapC family toxin [Candidatus Lokiarchaeota archaeon]
MNGNTRSSINAAVLDTSVLIEVLGKTQLGETIKNVVLKDPAMERFYISPLAVTELLYLVARTAGFQMALQQVEGFTKVFTICEENELRIEAARIKTTLALSLADCYALAIGRLRGIPVYFKRESEFDAILKKGSIPFPIDLRFVDDL